MFQVLHVTSFDEMKSDSIANYSWSSEKRNAEEGDFLRKGKVGDWRNYFTSELSKRYDAKTREIMKGHENYFEGYCEDNL